MTKEYFILQMQVYMTNVSLTYFNKRLKITTLDFTIANQYFKICKWEVKENIIPGRNFSTT